MTVINMAFKREKSVVRFETHVNYIDRDIPSPALRTSTKILGTRTSSLSLNTKGPRTHQYIPRLHRQTTEIPKATPLGSTLKYFTQTCLVDELSMREKASALEELKFTMSNVAKALSRNLLGLQLLPPVFAIGFSHWQSQPEKRVICYLPVRLARVEKYLISSDKVFLQLPRHFPSGFHIEPKDLEGYQLGYHKFISSSKFYSLVIKILKRALITKSVDPANINFSPSQRLMEVTLQENAGWIGEIVPCIVSGTSESVFYSCKPVYEPPQKSIPTEENPRKYSFNTYAKDGRYSHCSSRLSITRELQHMCESASIPDENADSLLWSEHDMICINEGRDISLAETNRSHTTSHTVRRIRSQVSEHRCVSKDVYITDSSSVMENLSDIHWYPCSPLGENKVFEAVSKTDGGVSITAMMIVCKLSQHDWRLVSLRCYDVQTAMLHDVDNRLDRCPRWQRHSLQHCVRSILSRLYEYARQASKKNTSTSNKALFHSSVDSANLWSHWDQKQLKLAEGALQRLTSNDTSLVSLLCRAGGISVEDVTY